MKGMQVVIVEIPTGGKGKGAALLGAALDLYNALETLAEVAESRGIPADAAFAALAKARGEL